MVIEKPIDTYVSPITRIVNLVLSLFNQSPDPARHLAAIARNLRIPTESNHVCVEADVKMRSLGIIALLTSTAAKASPAANDPLQQKLQSLLGPDATADTILQARAFLDRVEKAAATERLTVAHPTLTSTYAAMKYDYMSGYLWMFIMSFIGICITIAFTRFEAKGLIRKRGIEEAQAS